MPSDSQEATLVLERCARRFQEEALYKQDPRYLKIWISYADRLSSPGEIFKFLHKKKIGTTQALFWAAWAFVAEKSGNFSLADKLYTKGIELHALPIELLAERRHHFQRRMSRHWLRLNEEGRAAAFEGGDEGGPEGRGGRSALATKKEKRR
ncbi:checkpoint serine/threonine-protein kinase [Nannochloropsis gaditana CCMP526]|nr:checkpoint serine/threonine-protein kinase [Nannochloropsis gaditana CCMP526]EKU22394.1 checkpoint serine/threonine-protein kinase [Nannochloropsis gaditana CCMP526]|eukprot:XP_005853969.1 checkpoint serine/threonine-protein kinase [Nannochloropsis gaditana CCMP526]